MLEVTSSSLAVAWGVGQELLDSDMLQGVVDRGSDVADAVPGVALHQFEEIPAGHAGDATAAPVALPAPPEDFSARSPGLRFSKHVRNRLYFTVLHRAVELDRARAR